MFCSYLDFINSINSTIISVDMTGSNKIYHTATHDADPTLFQNCSFIAGNNTLYSVGKAVFQDCKGNIVTKSIFPLSSKEAKNKLLGSNKEIKIVDSKIIKLTKKNTQLNLNAFKYLGKKIFQIAPDFSEVKGLTGNSLDDIPRNFNGTVLLYSGDYKMTVFSYWHDVSLKIVGIGRPKIKNNYSFGSFFKCCTNITVDIYNVDFYSTKGGRYWNFGFRYSLNSTSTVWNANVDLSSTSEKKSGVGCSPNCSGCKGIMVGGTLLTKNGLNYGSMSEVYNNVDCYTNSYLLPAGKLINNVLVNY